MICCEGFLYIDLTIILCSIFRYFGRCMDFLKSSWHANSEWGIMEEISFIGSIVLRLKVKFLLNCQDSSEGFAICDFICILQILQFQGLRQWQT